MDEFKKVQKIYYRIKKEPGFDPNNYFWEMGTKTLIDFLKKYFEFMKEGDGIESMTLFEIPIRPNYAYLNHLELYKKITDDINFDKKSFNFYKNVTEGK